MKTSFLTGEKLINKPLDKMLEMWHTTRATANERTTCFKSFAMRTPDGEVSTLTIEKWKQNSNCYGTVRQETVSVNF